jgi:hypothetical protein
LSLAHYYDYNNDHVKIYLSVAFLTDNKMLFIEDRLEMLSDGTYIVNNKIPINAEYSQNSQSSHMIMNNINAKILHPVHRFSNISLSNVSDEMYILPHVTDVHNMILQWMMFVKLSKLNFTFEGLPLLGSQYLIRPKQSIIDVVSLVDKFLIQPIWNMIIDFLNDEYIDIDVNECICQLCQKKILISPDDPYMALYTNNPYVKDYVMNNPIYRYENDECDILMYNNIKQKVNLVHILCLNEFANKNNTTDFRTRHSLWRTYNNHTKRKSTSDIVENKSLKRLKPDV